MSDELGQPSPESNGQIGSRGAIGVIVAGVGAIGAVMAGLIGGFLSNTFRQRSTSDWIRLGPVEDIGTQTFKRYVLRVPRAHAWIEQRRPLITYVIDRFDPDDPEPKDPLALASTCTHLGCTVQWDDETRKFRCPCHGGVYNEQGEVIEGPPPDPLPRLDVKLDDQGICWVRPPGDDSTTGTATA